MIYQLTMTFGKNSASSRYFACYRYGDYNKAENCSITRHTKADFVNTIMNLTASNYNRSRSQRPRGLRRRTAAERLLGSWVRISPGAWMFVSCECLCCQVEVSATGRSLVRRNPTDCGVCQSAIK
jgi:hypothetical protein